jgi:hypothetical protein
MQTKLDFQQAIADTVDSYPAVAALYQAGDPRILQHLDAMATMLAMQSSQIEVAMAEVFEKVRDATVLADAAMRGIIRKARPGRVRITVTNNNAEPFNVETGRVLLDSAGNYYRVEVAAIVPIGETSAIEAIQIKTETITHVVSDSVPFYEIEIPDADDESYLSGIAVSDVNGDYEYRERYVNTLAGDRVFNVEADDRQNIYVRFGYDGIVGIQPVNGSTINLTITRTVGEIAPDPGSPFSFEYLLLPADSNVELELDVVLDSGQAPPDMATIRDMCKYPSVYDHNAVFLGEFEFVVRRQYSNTQFLSIWNELVEETARGANVDHINTLFVAVLSAEGNETTLTEPNPASPVAPTTILEASYTTTQRGIKKVIQDADDSYRVKFLTPVRSEIVMTITAVVSTSYVASDVQSKIAEAILAEYGAKAAASKRGGNRPLYKRVYALLKEKIIELADTNADLQVTIAQPIGDYRPELWRYVSAASLTVTVTTENIVSQSWG